jgi:hypothetical protein
MQLKYNTPEYLDIIRTHIAERRQDAANWVYDSCDCFVEKTLAYCDELEKALKQAEKQLISSTEGMTFYDPNL